MASQKFYSDVDLLKNQIKNGTVELLTEDPTGGDLWAGRVWYNTTNALYMGYDGTSVKPFNKVDHSDVYDFDAQVNTHKVTDLTAPTSEFSMNTQKITNVGAPAAATDAATKGYVDGVAQGLITKDAVKLATTVADGNIDLTTGGIIFIDGVEVAVGNRVLVKNQTDAKQNGIYEVKAGAWTRTVDADNTPSNELRGGVYVYVQDGTQQQSGWVINKVGEIAIGVDNITWTQFNGAGQIDAGAGLDKTGNTLSVKVDSDTIEINNDILRVKASGIDTNEIANVAVTEAKIATDAVTESKIYNGAVTTAKIAADAVDKTKINADVAGAGLVQAVGGELDVAVKNGLEIDGDALQVKLDGATITQGTNGIKVSTAGVDTNELADDSVTKAKINADVAGNALGQNADGSLEVKVDGDGIEIDTDALRLKDSGVKTAKINDDAVTKEKINADVAGAALGQNADGSLEVKVGDGIEIVADAITIDIDGLTLTKGTDGLKVSTGGITTTELATTSVTADKINDDVAGLGLSKNGTSKALDVNVDGSTIEINSDSLRVVAGGITVTQLGDSAVETAKINDDAVTKAKINADVAGSGLGQNADGSLEVNVGNGIQITSDAVAVKLDGDTLAVGVNGLKVADTYKKLKYVETIGDGTTTDFTITHDLGTRDVFIRVYLNGSTYETIEVYTDTATANTATVSFAVAPSSSSMRVVVLG